MTAAPRDDARAAAAAPRTSLVGAFAGLLLALAAAGCGLLVLAWLTGRVVSDRFLWSQWLLWIPGPAALAASLAGLVLAGRPARRTGRRRRRLLAWGLVMVLVTAHFTLVEHHLLRRPGAGGGDGGLRLVHWTMSHAKRPDGPEGPRTLELAGDITIVSFAGGVNTTPEFRSFDPDGHPPPTIGPYSILTRLPILSMRHVIGVDRIGIIRARIDASEVLGRVLTIDLVDLPSDPKRSRMEVARRARRLLDETGLPPPDLVLGDFNTTRGSAAMGTLFPDLVHAYDVAGGGYAATYRRPWPMYHIDHLLLGPGMTATSYEIVDPGFGRHLAQVAEIRVAP